MPTDENPSDIASRGANISSLLQSRWFTGPEFLWSEPINYLVQPKVQLSLADPEVKKSSALFTSLASPLRTVDQKLERYSTWSRAQKAIAIVQQKLHRAPKLDLKTAEQGLIRMIQRERFKVNIAALTKSNKLGISSLLLKLNPFLDKKGLPRVGGRLQKSMLLCYEEKHPILLPKSAQLTKLIIRHFHA